MKLTNSCSPPVLQSDSSLDRGPIAAEPSSIEHLPFHSKGRVTEGCHPPLLRPGSALLFSLPGSWVPLEGRDSSLYPQQEDQTLAVRSENLIRGYLMPK